MLDNIIFRRYSIVNIAKIVETLRGYDMDRISDKELKQYFKHIKLLLPLRRKKEKQFLKELQTSITDFINLNPDCSFADICSHFGKPQEVVKDYLSTMDSADLCKQVCVRKRIKHAAVIILSLCLIAFLLHAGVIYKIYLDEKNQVITHRLIVIE